MADIQSAMAEIGEEEKDRRNHRAKI